MRVPRTPMMTLLICLIIQTGCMNNGIEWSELSFTRAKPKTEDLVGTWTPTNETVRDMSRRGKYTISHHELTLSSDGTFSMRNMPDWWSDGFGKSHQRFESGSGTWEIQRDLGPLTTIYVVKLQFPEIWKTVNLSGQKPPYQLHITLGDPDSGEYMLFERTALHAGVLDGASPSNHAEARDSCGTIPGDSWLGAIHPFRNG